MEGFQFTSKDPVQISQEINHLNQETNTLLAEFNYPITHELAHSIKNFNKLAKIYTEINEPDLALATVNVSSNFFDLTKTTLNYIEQNGTGNSENLFKTALNRTSTFLSQLASKYRNYSASSEEQYQNMLRKHNARNGLTEEQQEMCFDMVTGYINPLKNIGTKIAQLPRLVTRVKKVWQGVKNSFKSQKAFAQQMIQKHPHATKILRKAFQPLNTALKKAGDTFRKTFGKNKKTEYRPPSPHPSMPVGRRGQKPTPNTSLNFESKIIYGREYSGHAIQRINERGLTPMVIEDIIKNGARSVNKNPGRLSFYDKVNKVTVITCENTGRVITIMPGKI